MAIVKRLLNVLTVVALLTLGLALYGWGQGFIEYRGKLAEQRIACSKKIEFDRMLAEQKALPPERQAPIFRPDVSYKYLCERKIESQIFVRGKTDLAIGALFLVVVAVLNYVLVGKVTVWNRSHT